MNMAMEAASISKTLTKAFLLRGSRCILSSSSPSLSSSPHYSTAFAAVLDVPPAVETTSSPRPQGFAAFTFLISFPQYLSRVSGFVVNGVILKAGNLCGTGRATQEWLFVDTMVAFSSWDDYFWPWDLADLQKRGEGNHVIATAGEKLACAENSEIKVLEHRQRRLALEPMKLNDPSPADEQLDALEFRRVSCKGVFDEDRSIFVGPRSRSISGVTENGFYVVTPLMPIPGDPTSVKSPILVNRGWVPRICKERSLEPSLNTTNQLPDVSAVPKAHKRRRGLQWWWFRSKKPQTTEDQPPSSDPVEVIGVVRGSENPSIFVPENDPNSGQWFYVDIPAIAASCGLRENDIIYVEDVHENVNPSCPYPVPKDVTTLISSSVMPQDHLNYSFTWYTLSAAVTFMAFKRLKQRQTRR
ncbi:unnamed protein product [Linum tenue]|uniref:SURF1-like protein n=1 Tax=Linum tenue TaxID=586396 RepID=A0AAV0H7L0_9ROSI|nr:unnamed protein product [Linum tenue]